MTLPRGTAIPAGFGHRPRPGWRRAPKAPYPADFDEPGGLALERWKNHDATTFEL